MINVLQYNPTSNSKIRTPQKREMVAFKHQLEQVGLEVTMRVSHGREIKAACGQLANTFNQSNKIPLAKFKGYAEQLPQGSFLCNETFRIHERGTGL